MSVHSSHVGSMNASSRPNSRPIGSQRQPSRGVRSQKSQNRRPGTGQRPDSSVSHFSLTFCTDFQEFQKQAEEQAPAESQFLCFDGNLTSDDLTSGVAEYLQACAQLDIQPRMKIVQQIRQSTSSMDFSNVQLGPKGATALGPAFKKLHFTQALQMQNCGLKGDGVQYVLEQLIGTTIETVSPSQVPEVVPVFQNLSVLNLAQNDAGDKESMLLKKDMIYPGLPRAHYDFALEQRKRVVQKQNEVVKKTEEKKNDKEPEFVPVSTVLLGLGQSQTRPYLPPKVSEKGGKAPEVPEVLPLDSRLGIVGKIDSLGLENVSHSARCMVSLGTFRLLTQLNLSDNALGDRAISALGVGLSQMSSLQRLEIRRNKITELGLLGLLQGLSESPVHHLDLGQNRISLAGAAVLGCYLARQNKDLRSLKLDANPLGDMGAAFLLLSVCGGGYQLPQQKKKVAAAANGKQAPKQEQQIAQYLKDLQREEEPEFDSAEQQIFYTWQKTLEKCQAQFQHKLEWCAKAPDSNGDAVALELPDTGFADLSSCALVKLLKNNKQLLLQIQNNPLSEPAFYQIMKALKSSGDNVEQLVLDWNDIDEERLEQVMDPAVWEDYSSIVEKVAGLGERVVFVRVE